MIYVLLVLFLTFLSFFIYFIILKKRIIGFYLKGLTSLSFISVYSYGIYNFYIENNGLLIAQNNNEFFYFTIFLGLGLIFGLVGDLFLEVQYFFESKKDIQIFYGMIVFFIGHVFYIVAMSILVDFNFLSILIGLAFTLIIVVGGHILKMEFGVLRIPSYLYTFIIFTMVGQALFLVMSNQFNQLSICFLIGAVLFAISDLILAPIYFKNERRTSFSILNLLTYYFAQLLLALTVLFLV